MSQLLEANAPVAASSSSPTTTTNVFVNFDFIVLPFVLMNDEPALCLRQVFQSRAPPDLLQPVRVIRADRYTVGVRWANDVTSTVKHDASLSRLTRPTYWPLLSQHSTGQRGGATD